ncbi:MAG: tRNA guanosine(34) transglycosylase Tgt [Candidatus Saliniplasma sp.]
MIDFELKATDENARAGTLTVDDKECLTPVFMPVGTRASVKTLLSEDLYDLGVQAIITNFYHLMMKPGIDIIEEGGGLHEFMNYDGLIFTDSGGFQMIRKGFDQKMEGDTVTFKSEYDGSIYKITPEECISLQKRLDSDVQMCLDYCPSYPADRDELEFSVKKTKRWAEMCKEEEGNIFGISQGGTDKEFRKRSCQDMVDIGFEGLAIGGLSIGEPKEKMYDMLEIANRTYPAEKPRYLMGLGSPVDILEAIERGCDIFDSAYPTRNARHRSVFTVHGTINIENSQYKKDKKPLDEECGCPICENYTRSYINHLCRADELSWMRMTSIHNLHFLTDLMEKARYAISSGTFKDFKCDFVSRYE